MKGIIGIPTTGELPVEFVESLLKLETPPGTELRFMARSTIHVARETLARETVKGGFDFLLMIDDDMTFPPDTLTRLLALNAPAASALCFKRTPPYTPCCYSELKVEKNTLTIKPFEFESLPESPFRAAAAGAACMLLRREALEKTVKPLFLPLPFAGEDICFCYRLQQAELPLVIEPGLRIGHLERRAVGWEEYRLEAERTEGAL